MSAADRMTVRTPDGKVQVVPRRVGLGMIARNQAKAERGARGATVPPQDVVVPAVRVQRTPHVHIETPAPVPVVTVPRVEPVNPAPVEPADDDPTSLPIEAPEVEQPKGNATRKTWADYAALHGVEVTDGMTRNMIRDAVVAKLESDRLSQPAFSEFEGGRLATPEDEPVTTGVVTSADPGDGQA